MFKQLLTFALLIFIMSCNNTTYTNNSSVDKTERIDSITILLPSNKIKHDSLSPENIHTSDKLTLDIINSENSSKSKFLSEGYYINSIVSYYDSIYFDALGSEKLINYNYIESPTCTNIENGTIIRNYQVLENNSYNITSSSIYIPLTDSIKVMNFVPMTFGDLNNDGLLDCIIQIHSEGSFYGPGGNSYKRDLFVFINDKGNYKLERVINHTKFKEGNTGVSIFDVTK